MESFVDLWELVKSELKANLSEVIYNVWLNELELESFEGSKVVLSIVEFKRKIVEQKFYDVLCRTFEKVLGFKVEVILVDPASAKPSKDKGENSESIYIENTFDTFVVG
ncbi:MAG TPA: DnaA N-terminal domain-containing protein, partial [Clostridia bacterium]|nr:DnaA N-terminal domain-containing protein [Clostridia bacterium]